MISSVRCSGTMMLLALSLARRLARSSGPACSPGAMAIAAPDLA